MVTRLQGPPNGLKRSGFVVACTSCEAREEESDASEAHTIPLYGGRNEQSSRRGMHSTIHDEAGTPTVQAAEALQPGGSYPAVRGAGLSQPERRPAQRCGTLSLSANDRVAGALRL